MTPDDAGRLLDRFKAGKAGKAEVLRAFQARPFVDLGFAKVDTHRSLRKGYPEVIFGSGKTASHIAAIAGELFSREGRVLITRLDEVQSRAVRKKFPKAVWSPMARCLLIEKAPQPKRPGTIAVVSAGTSDLPIAEEAAFTADAMGNHVERIYDVGVAGLHRLLARVEDLQSAQVLVVVAGMEGALPSVVAGLVSRPVIAVPTSIGYGAAFGGMAALLGMLTSCGSGVTVVNIDNGFGAGYAASQINALAHESRESTH